VAEFGDEAAAAGAMHVEAPVELDSSETGLGEAIARHAPVEAGAADEVLHSTRRRRRC